MGVFLPSLTDVGLVSPSSQPKTPDSSPLSSIVGVVVESILEVFFLCLVGWILAKKGIVDDKAKKTLNKINTSLFTPCLLFNKVAFSLTPDKLAELYIIPIGFVLVSAFSASTAWGFGKLVGLKKGQRNFAIACATFQNSNSLPIALLQSLIGEKLPLAWSHGDTKDAMLGRGLSYLVLFSSLGIIVRWSVGVRLLTSAETEQDEEAPSAGDPEAALEAPNVNGGASSSSESTLRAETGENDDDDDDEDEDEDVNGAEEGEGTALLKHKPSTTGSILKPSRTRETTAASTTSANGNGNSNSSSKLVVLPPTSFDAPETVPSSRQIRKKRGRIFQSFPNTPIPSVYGGSRAASTVGSISDDEDENDSEGEEGEDDAAWGSRRGALGRRFTSRSSLPARAWRKTKKGGKKVWRKVRKVGHAINEFMTVPLWAAILSLVVACIPPLQRFLGEMEPLKAAIRSAGACSVPITLVTLGAYFYRPSPSASASTSALVDAASSSPSSPISSAPPTSFSATLLRRLRHPFEPLPQRHRAGAQGARRGETRTVLVAVLTRMVIVPAVLIPLFGYYAAKTVNVADDPIFVIVACLLIGSPTAITLAQITSASAGPTFELLITRTLFISYAILTAPSTVILVVASLYIDRLQHPEKALVDVAWKGLEAWARR